MIHIITENEYKNQYRNKKIEKWLSADLTTGSLRLVIYNETGYKVK